MTTTTDRWQPLAAAERLAERHGNLLDYVGRVDQAVTGGDLHYLIEKGQALINATERLVALANELVDERVSVQEHLPVIEAYLMQAGAIGYRAIAALHPQPVTL